MTDDDEITRKAQRTASALEAKAASVADDLKGIAIDTAKELQAVMKDLAVQMIALAGEMRSLSTYGKRNRRLIRLLAVSVCFDVALSIGLGVLFLRANHNAAQTSAIIATRTESRAAQCASDNRFISNHNALVDALEKSIQLANQPNPTRTPEQQEAADKFFADYTVTIEAARVPLRDCSPAAIEAFYKGR